MGASVVRIIERSTDEPVEAELRPSRLDDGLLWAGGWLPRFPADAEDSGWD